MSMNKKGFTLMELLIVVIMISGLVAVAYPSYISSIERARASEAVNMLGAIKAAQEKNFIMYDNYAETFREIRDFSPAISSDPDDENHFNLNSNSFKTEYFEYTMRNDGTSEDDKFYAEAIRITPQGNNAGKGYSFTASYRNDFISCNSTTTEGEKICSSLTDQPKQDDGSYRIF